MKPIAQLQNRVPRRGHYPADNACIMAVVNTRLRQSAIVKVGEWDPCYGTLVALECLYFLKLFRPKSIVRKSASILLRETAAIPTLRSGNAPSLSPHTPLRSEYLEAHFAPVWVVPPQAKPSGCLPTMRQRGTHQRSGIGSRNLPRFEPLQHKPASRNLQKVRV